ncbi:MAG: Clp protease N-terminal domain-containing protein, partial [Candidatus Kapaibacterium sp.]
MNFDNFTIKSQEAINNATLIAKSYNNQAIEPAHLFASLIQDDQSMVSNIINRNSNQLGILKIKVTSLIEKYPKVSNLELDNYVSNDLRKVFSSAESEAKLLKDEFISSEHLLLGLIETNNSVSELLNNYGINKKEVYRIMKYIRGTHSASDKNAEDKYDSLNKYGRNLNLEAQKGKIDPVIGREGEIRRVLQVLARRTKNNPLLIGEPGVGKTAIVEGIAQRIVSGDVPDGLKDK